jgi:hypothetical protein
VRPSSLREAQHPQFSFRVLKSAITSTIEWVQMIPAGRPSLLAFLRSTMIPFFLHLFCAPSLIPATTAAT